MKAKGWNSMKQVNSMKQANTTVNPSSESEVLLCKDCIHSYVPFWRHTFGTMFNEHLKGNIMRCKKVLYKVTSDINNPVTGPTAKVFKNILCIEERKEGLHVHSYGQAQCGKQGKLWSPKKKEDIFKLLKR